MSYTQRDPDKELPADMLEMIRFFIKDHAFSKEFLVTARRGILQKEPRCS